MDLPKPRTVEIEQFDPNVIKPGSFIFILGAPDSGKTTLIKKLYPPDELTIFLPGCAFDYDHIRPEFIYHSINDLPGLVSRMKQKQRAAAGYRQNVQFAHPKLIIDDPIEEPDGIMSDFDQERTLRSKRWEESYVAGDLLHNSRHFSAGVILASRYMLIQRLHLRKQLGYTIIFGEDMFPYRLEHAYRYYVDGIISKNLFKKLMSSLHKHQALVFDHYNQQVYYI